MSPTPDSVGEVIATRTLTLDGTKQVQVLIGRPQRFQNGQSWYCPYRIPNVGLDRILYAAGVDEVQALILALSMIGAKLYTSDEYIAGRLSWVAGQEGDLGFPVPESIRDVLPGNRGSGGTKQG